MIKNFKKLIDDFIKNNIGQIKGIMLSKNIMYIIKYETNIPYPKEHEKTDRIALSKNFIINKSENKEDLEIYLQSKKYNL